MKPAISAYTALGLLFCISTPSPADANARWVRCQESCVGMYEFCSENSTKRSQGQVCMYFYDRCLTGCNNGDSYLRQSLWDEVLDLVGMRDPDEMGSDCPDGSRPNPLGLCIASFEGVEPEPNCEPTADDNCLPKIKVTLLPKDTGFVTYCPAPLMPMPGGEGCRPMPADGSGDGFEDHARQCPEGMQPGPQDRCIPSLRPGLAGEIDQAMRDFAASGGTETELLRLATERMAEAGIRTEVADPVSFLANTREALGETWRGSTGE